TLVYCDGHHALLHSLPTRRSSDLCWSWRAGWAPAGAWAIPSYSTNQCLKTSLRTCSTFSFRSRSAFGRISASMTSRWHRASHPRSEEHTSELQSRFDLVCRLLLEK